MANPTTNYAFVLPTPTDLVTDLPADFDIALQGVDTRLKALQPGTTAGDLAYSSATANTNVRLGIGTTDQILTVVAGAPAWAINSGYKPLPYIANNYYMSPAVATRGTNAFVAGVTSYTPIFIRETRTFTRIALITGTTFSGTASIRLGIYNQTNGVPSTLVLDAGTVAPTSASQQIEITISQSLPVGWHWLAANTITAATTNTLQSFAASSVQNTADMGGTSAGVQFIGYTQTVSAASSFVAAVSPAQSNAVMPFIQLRA